jgi:hypothetical protein
MTDDDVREDDVHKEDEPSGDDDATSEEVVETRMLGTMGRKVPGNWNPFSKRGRSGDISAKPRKRT